MPVHFSLASTLKGYNAEVWPVKSLGKEDIYRLSVDGNNEGFRDSHVIATRPKIIWERRRVGNDAKYARLYAVARF